jgi:MurNAc alpha-1-phosphate uridylyltransferase
LQVFLCEGLTSKKSNGKLILFCWSFKQYTYNLVLHQNESTQSMTPIKTAMILAAGFGTRLRPLTLNNPKPLLEIKGTPCIQYIVNYLKTFGIEKIVINTHYLAAQIHTYFQNDPQIILINEKEILETGGAIKNAIKELDDIFLTVNGDIWFNDPEIFQRMTYAFDEKIMDALLMMVPTQNALFFSKEGDYYPKKDCLDAIFQLIHKEHQIKTDQCPAYIYGGIQIWSKKEFLNYTSPNKKYPMLPVFHEAEKKNRLWGICYNHLWCDIGTLESYNSLNKILSF